MIDWPSIFILKWSGIDLSYLMPTVTALSRLSLTSIPPGTHPKVKHQIFISNRAKRSRCLLLNIEIWTTKNQNNKILTIRLFGKWSAEYLWEESYNLRYLINLKRNLTKSNLFCLRAINWENWYNFSTENSINLFIISFRSMRPLR